MSNRVSLRKAVLELIKQAGSDSTVQSQISENAENKQHDRNSSNSRERNSEEDVTLAGIHFGEQKQKNAFHFLSLYPF